VAAGPLKVIRKVYLKNGFTGLSLKNYNFDKKEARLES
jgi:hypothetical protein